MGGISFKKGKDLFSFLGGRRTRGSEKEGAGRVFVATLFIVGDAALREREGFLSPKSSTMNRERSRMRRELYGESRRARDEIVCLMHSLGVSC